MDQPLSFSGLRRAPDLFKAAQNQTTTELLCYQLDLSTLRTFSGTGANAPVVLNLAGNAWFIDQKSDVGNADIIFNDKATSANPIGIFAQPGAIYRVTANQLTIANTAQAGKFLRIWYGVDVDFTPGLSLTGTSNTNVINSSLVVKEAGNAYGASYKSTTALAANTPETIVAAGSNVNGVTIWHASTYSRDVTAQQSGVFIAKATAPATVIDGDVLCGSTAGSEGAGFFCGGGMIDRPLIVPAGKGLFYISTTAMGQCQRMMLYTIL